ncbi:NodT family efflux transporter outer membrane factor (OMF) lipoprotein [Candidatus Methylobacter favarea]|uniref:NodT family efflux transporter outer membrane factor (OMF) lipoprotein n=1 Tax=Candidatus Methylobacter favarea TaxID=2707345 RepID=A0A8S0WJR9_9GAMM|nr:efflux transporter outer membrane subunit [Candidatus Methylobacter favarea]CAA9891498.1 NodT family efflux transporter outer membrane factor (OMF) lipoprotein [Candidatus Methylobacter favarea]
MRRAQTLVSGIYAGVMLLIAGCAWIPSGDKPAEFMKTPALEQALVDTGRDKALAAEPWPPERWWREFGSSELNSLMDIALKENRDVKVAAARLRQAQAMTRVEGARLLPFLDAEVNFENKRISENGVFSRLNPETAGANIVFGEINPFSFRYEFDFWGKNRAALESALGESAAEDAEHAEVLLELTSAIARSYIQGSALKQQLDLAQAMLELRRELLAMDNTRLRLGLDSADRVKQATIELEQANKREAAIRDQLDIQRNLLARLIGNGPDSTQNLFIDTALGPEKIRLPAKLPLELLGHRPDLAAALHRAEAAAQRVKVAKASFLPTIDLTAFAGINALRLTKGASSLANVLFSGSSFSYGIAPGLRLPWFEGGRLRGELSAQRAEYDEAVELYNKTLLQAVQEVADSLSRWRESRSILEAHGRLLAAQQENLGFAQVRFRSGLDDRRALLAHQHAVLNQEYALKTLEADRLVAIVDLMEALGGGYVNDLKIIEQKPEKKLFSWLPWQS